MDPLAGDEDAQLGPLVDVHLHRVPRFELEANEANARRLEEDLPENLVTDLDPAGPGETVRRHGNGGNPPELSLSVDRPARLADASAGLPGPAYD
jgi:hypothetical protein